MWWNKDEGRGKQLRYELSELQKITNWTSEVSSKDSY